MNNQLIGDDGELLNDDTEARNELLGAKSKRKRIEYWSIGECLRMVPSAGGVVIATVVVLTNLQTTLTGFLILQLIALSLGVFFWRYDRIFASGFFVGTFLVIVGLSFYTGVQQNCPC